MKKSFKILKSSQNVKKKTFCFFTSWTKFKIIIEKILWKSSKNVFLDFLKNTLTFLKKLLKIVQKRFSKTFFFKIFEKFFSKFSKKFFKNFQNVFVKQGFFHFPHFTSNGLPKKTNVHNFQKLFSRMLNIFSKSKKKFFLTIFKIFKRFFQEF